MKRALMVGLLTLAACVTEPETVKQEPTPQAAASDIGIILMHGKGGTTRWVEDLSDDLENAGYVVETPLLPWARGRLYDRTYQDSLMEIDAAVEKLKTKGAKRIVIGGHSLGANVALGYAVNRKGLSGIMMLAPGHFPSGNVFGRVAGPSVERARRMIEQGQGDKKDDFADTNQGRESLVNTSAKIYLSWFDPYGPASMRANAPWLIGVPVLWVGGHSDRFASEIGPRLVYEYLPGNPLHRLELINSDHLRTPQDSTAPALKWLKSLP